ncbi:aminoglycoside phosphotransferase family protein [Actinoplanes sp. NPDC051633]|uniref:aminoglycoside phosphotransferase family protein n=1 Tax=Actinoplanes sp. NPDC051633 TaxID=3155670 RepID=UPI0034399301
MDRSRLNSAAREAFGRDLTGAARLAGGSRKGVYRLTLDDATTAIAYVWTAEENYWPAREGDGDPAEMFNAGVGLELYLAAQQRLASLGLRTPAIYLAGGDLAIVEDFPGEDLEDRLARDPAAAEPVMARLAEDLAAMRAYRAPAYGKVAFVDAGGRPNGGEVLAFGRRMLREAAARDARIAAARERLSDKLLELAAAVQPRAEYSVVHGELWGHVLIDGDERPVMIDIEDLMYFDVEWEHVFLGFRLGADYHRLAVDGLDGDRVAFYTLVQRLSLTAGPLRLLEGDYPNRAFMQGIADWNGAQAIKLCSGPTARSGAGPRSPSG